MANFACKIAEEGIVDPLGEAIGYIVYGVFLTKGG